MIHVPSLIEAKRDGRELTEADIRALVDGYTRGDIPDYQMSAFAMAVYFRGMSDAETAALTSAMMESGAVLSYPADTPPRADKHSTGGVGDKISLVLAPLVAGEVWVPMISGRGLGITGGTLDKLESIPGFRTAIPEAEALAQLARVGVFMIGQTDRLCPADRKLYALRDVTATIPSQPLIVASIMSKKLAENLDRLVLDVKFGSGAFMKTRAEAESLASRLAAIGVGMGVAVSTVLSPMDQPLGRTAGNALEVAEAADCLRGQGPPDVVELVLDLAERISPLPREALRKRLQDGTAWQTWIRLVEAQGGDASAMERIREVRRAPVIRVLEAPSGGTVIRYCADAVGRACVALGAGRAKASDAVDPRVGCEILAKTGDRVERSQPLARIHAADESAAARAAATVLAGITIA